MNTIGLTSIFKGFQNKYKEYQYAKMLNGYIPIFSQFGDDIYASDVVKNCIRAIANEISKLQPKHIRTDNNDMQITVNSNINKLLRFSPNELMTTKEFLEKITWLWFLDSNCFIYPTFVDIPNNNGGTIRNYTGFYPLRPVLVEFLQDSTDTLFIRFTFSDGGKHTLPYADIIHWRRDFSLNDLMGGDEFGKPDNAPLLKVLKINDTIVQGLDKAVRSSLSIRGILKINTMLDDEKQQQERVKFEQKLKDSESGFMPMDLKGEYMPITTNPVILDKTTLEFVQNKILNNFGVSMPILSGDFTDEQYQAFYEKTLEPMIIGLGQAFSKTLFSRTQLDFGNEVIFYPQNLLFTNTKNKIAVADILGNRGALTDNQLLALFGYPPFEGGDIRHMSLNFINREIADQYQMLNMNKGKGVAKDE